MFTGNSRAKRQVNLSGRTSNPFAAHGSSSPSTTQTSHSAITHARQERILRDRERQRPPAATKIQQNWRGYSRRRQIRDYWRKQWDAVEGREDSTTQVRAYGNTSECLHQLRLLAQFASPRSADDLRRLLHFSKRYLAFIQRQPDYATESWVYPASRLARTLIRVLDKDHSLAERKSDEIHGLVALLTALTSISTQYLAWYSHDYYKSVDNVWHHWQDSHSVQGLVLAMLNGHKHDAYRGFAWIYLRLGDLPGFTNGMAELARHVYHQGLSLAVNALLFHRSNNQLIEANDSDGLLWLLARLIYFHDHPSPESERETLPELHYVKVISRLITVLADDIGKRIDGFDMRSLSGNIVSNGDTPTPIRTLPAFVREQILSLVSQQNVNGLVSSLESRGKSSITDLSFSTEASDLASYVLTLLRVFPRRRNDIQLWLYWGSVTNLGASQQRLPTAKYLYEAASTTPLFLRVSSEPKSAIHFLAPKDMLEHGKYQGDYLIDRRDEQWRIVLLFLELYTFILQVMDDEEFHAGTEHADPSLSWTKQSALPLDSVRKLSSFLKKLAFALYWYPAEIAGEQEVSRPQSLAAYFGRSDDSVDIENEEQSVKADEREIAGVRGVTISSLKGLVVGVLRMLYQRDSRRKFLPKNHWLMTEYFEMDRFIASVVEEEEHGRKIEESYDEFDDDASTSNHHDRSNSMNNDDGSDNDMSLVGTQRERQIRRAERLRARQRKASKRKYLESVTPRLRILENMPFFIPFHTRVQIFREFVELDQIHRRGTADPDEWRYMQMNSPMGNISRHRATVSREHIFDDALEQYYNLGEGLKEPIQIRFVDKFGTVEEGIDGGGVTKEFLTSVTNEAFSGANGMDALFVDNDQHLFYPNPNAIEERKETLRQAGFREGSPDWNDVIRNLRKRFEFLGRLIGKCLYEGILIDIQFAPFFLLKWALTGGSGSGARESGYRANLNDLRDLDEGLYQGLLQLKNYSGNVQEDFGLDFTVTDTLRLSPTQMKAVTRELRPSGSNIPVTNENRLVYIAAMAKHRLQTQPYRQTSDFLLGLGSIISPSWLSMFNQAELQTLIGGSGAEISVSDLRANTQYGGVYVIGDDGLEHPSIQLFWKVLQGMASEDMAKVLKFVTSTPRAPLLGFSHLNPKFSIRDSGGDQTRLPSTSTCVNLLKLPIYRDAETLKERLLYSVNSGAGFNLS